MKKIKKKHVAECKIIGDLPKSKVISLVKSPFLNLSPGVYPIRFFNGKKSKILKIKTGMTSYGFGWSVL